MENSNGKKTFKDFITSKKTAVVLTALITSAVILPITLNKPEAPNNFGDTSVSDSNNPDLELDKNAGEYVEPEQEEVSQGVSIPGWSSITIPADSKEIAVDFFNPEENMDLYYLTFELRIPDNSEQGYEVLYTSGLVEPGLHIQKINLSRAFDKGTYDAVIHVQPYRMDEEKTATNNADLKTELIVM